MRIYNTIIVFFLTLNLHAADWPQEAGPERSNYTPETGFRIDWDQQAPPVAWTAEVGYGKSPSAVVGGRVYVFGAVAMGADISDGIQPAELPYPSRRRGDSDDEGMHQFVKNEKGKQAGEATREIAWCYDLDSGDVLWSTELWKNHPPDHSGEIVFSRSTPLVHEGRIYIGSFDARLGCLDAETGEMLWQQDMRDHGRPAKGIGKGGNFCSPLLLDNGLIAYRFGGAGRGGKMTAGSPVIIAVFDPTSGQRAWVSQPIPLGHHTIRGYKASINAGIINGQETIVASLGGATVGISATDGSVLWRYGMWNAFNMSEEAYEDAKGFGIGHPHILPHIWQDHVVDANWRFYGNVNSIAHCFEVVDGEPRFDWKTIDMLGWTNQYVRKDGLLIGIDSHRGGAAGTDRWADDPHRKIIPRSEGVGKVQCYDIASGELRWSSDAMFPMIGGKEEDTGMYGGEVMYIVAGDVLIAHFRTGIRLGRILPEGGLEQTAVFPQSGTRNPATPVLSQGRLLVRVLDGAGEANLTVYDLRHTK